MMSFFKFEEMITLKIVQAVYVLGVVIIILLAIGCLIEKNAIYGVAVIIIGNLVWRLLCEAIVVQFRIHEALTSLDKKTLLTPQ